MTQPLTNEPDVVTTIRLSPEEHEAIKAEAVRQHRSFSGQVRYIVAQWLEAPADSRAA